MMYRQIPIIYCLLSVFLITVRVLVPMLKHCMNVIKENSKYLLYECVSLDIQIHLESCRVWQRAMKMSHMYEILKKTLFSFLG